MAYDTKYGIIDPRSYMTRDQIGEWVNGYELSEDKVVAINAEIHGWVMRDPDGYSDYETRRLNDSVRTILQR